MNKKTIFACCLAAITAGGLLSFKVLRNNPAENAGLTLPQGFKASAIADNLGSARHLVATQQGDIYVHLDKPKDGKGIVVLHDNGDAASVKTAFGAFGGTGIRISNVYFYS
jgi:RNA binding exosome subunit